MYNEIKTKEQAEDIFNYCKSRLPKVDYCNLHVEQNGEYSGMDFIPSKGIVLALVYDKYLIARSIGVDVEDALLDIYKKLVLFTNDKKSQSIKAIKKRYFKYE